MLARTLLLLSLIAIAIPVEAQTDALVDAETAAGDGDFERASDLLLTVIHDPRRVSADVARAYALLGVVRATLGEEAAASQAFDWALALDPGLPTPAELGPAQRAMLDRLRAERHGRALAVTLDAPSSASVSEAATLSASATGAPTGESVRVTITAWPDDDESAAIDAEGDGHVELVIAAGAFRSAHEIHVRAEVSAGGPALAHDDARIARTGGATASGGGEIWQEAWFWVVIGVVAAGAIAGGVLAAVLPHDLTLGPPQLVGRLP